MSTAHTLQEIDQIYRRDSRRVFATLVRLLGDFDLAEEALHEAFRAALEQWPAQGVPGNPAAWLVSTGRFKAIDSIRRQARFTSTETLAEHVEAIADESVAADAADVLEDDSLRLIFTCCHPALAPDAQVALTLRLPSVLRVLYLVFNEGYSPSSGALVTRADLSQEALRLTRLITEVLPPPPWAEAQGLLALMLLHESRRAARADSTGHLIPLEEQDRTRWDTALIAEGCARVENALQMPGLGPYALQAAISAVHAEATSADATDWAQIVGLYDALLEMQPSPVVALNRAVAVAMHGGWAQGIALVDALLTLPAMQDYHLAHAARADLCRRAHRWDDARTSYQAVLARTQLEPERRFLARRLSEIAPG